ncbi:hypothetical protein HYZ64_04025 [Candidatus Berkelbacteria bacterium]|nr:hypothetical protein [Candidatus Berkelbacteria bacterium]
MNKKRLVALGGLCVLVLAGMIVAREINKTPEKPLVVVDINSHESSFGNEHLPTDPTNLKEEYPPIGIVGPAYVFSKTGKLTINKEGVPIPNDLLADDLLAPKGIMLKRGTYLVRVFQPFDKNHDVILAYVRLKVSESGPYPPGE